MQNQWKVCCRCLMSFVKSAGKNGMPWWHMFSPLLCHTLQTWPDKSWSLPTVQQYAHAKHSSKYEELFRVEAVSLTLLSCPVNSLTVWCIWIAQETNLASRRYIRKHGVNVSRLPQWRQNAKGLLDSGFCKWNGNPLKKAKFEGQKRIVLEIITAFYKSFND